MAGEIYDCHDAVFLEFKARTRRLLAEYHMLKYEEKEKKGNIKPDVRQDRKERFSGTAFFVRLWTKYLYRGQCIRQYELYLCGL